MPYLKWLRGLVEINNSRSSIRWGVITWQRAWAPAPSFLPDGHSASTMRFAGCVPLAPPLLVMLLHFGLIAEGTSPSRQGVSAFVATREIQRQRSQVSGACGRNRQRCRPCVRGAGWVISPGIHFVWMLVSCGNAVSDGRWAAEHMRLPRAWFSPYPVDLPFELSKQVTFGDGRLPKGTSNLDAYAVLG